MLEEGLEGLAETGDGQVVVRLELEVCFLVEDYLVRQFQGWQSKRLAMDGGRTADQAQDRDKDFSKVRKGRLDWG